MTSADPIRGIEYLGYTEREASFLYLVVVHSGYFLRRQFDQFIDRHNGAIAQHFLLRAKRRGHVAVLDFGQQRHVYHLFYKPFYRLLDNPDSQNRRRKSDAEIKLRLMALDYVLLHLGEEFLETREAKVRFFTGTLHVPPASLPQAGRYSQVPFADHTRATSAYSSAVIQLQSYPGSALSSQDAPTQTAIQNQYASSEIGQATLTNSLSTLGTIRSDSQTFQQKLANLESDTYSTDPSQQTSNALLGKINSATMLQIHSQQDTNQILAAQAAQQALDEKEQLDERNRLMNQSIYFQQNFPTLMQSMTSGVSDSIHSVSLSTTGH